MTTMDGVHPEWVREFGPEYAVPTVITNELVDISQHGERCPCFVVKTGSPAKLWVEPPGSCGRPRWRFFVTHGSDWVFANGGEHAVLEAIRIVKEQHANANKEQS